MAKVTWPAGRRTPRGRQNRSVGAFRDGGPPGQQRGGARGWPAAVHRVVACDSEPSFSVTAGPREFLCFCPCCLLLRELMTTHTCDERREPAEKSKPVSSPARLHDAVRTAGCGRLLGRPLHVPHAAALPHAGGAAQGRASIELPNRHFHHVPSSRRPCPPPCAQ